MRLLRALRALRVLRGSILLLGSAASFAAADDVIAPIARVLPPAGIELPPAERSKLNYETSLLKNRLIGVRDQPLKPDVEIYAKAVDYALRHGELTVRDLPAVERRGDHDSIQGAGVISTRSKPIACLPCDYALRSASTSLRKHQRKHSS